MTRLAVAPRTAGNQTPAALRRDRHCVAPVRPPRAIRQVKLYDRRPRASRCIWRLHVSPAVCATFNRTG